MANIVGGSIIWDLEVKDKSLSSELSNAKGKIEDLSKESEKSFAKIGASMTSLGKKMSLFVTTPILAAGGAALKLAADFEQSNVAFTTMLGSADKAQKLLKDLADFAIKTPFTLQGIEDTTKQLLAMGIEQEKLIPTVKALGDVSSGLSTDLDRMAYNFGQVKAQGRLTGVELRDFARAGVPLIAELAKNLNVSEQAIKDMVSAGEVGFDAVEQAFITMSSEGGKFNNLMQTQSGTTAGQFSNLKDQVSLLGREVGAQLLPMAVTLTQELIKLVQWVNTLNPEVIKWGIVIAGVMAAIGPLLIALPLMASGIALLTGPIGWVILAVVALAALVIANFDKIKFAIQFWGDFIKYVFNGIVTFFRNIGNSIVNAISEPFQRAFNTVRDIANKIREAANNINPFARHSPSLVDNVKKGIGIIQNEYASLRDVKLPGIMASLPTLSEPAYASAGMGSVGGSGFKQDVNINIDKIQNQSDIDALGREFGFRQSLLV